MAKKQNNNTVTIDKDYLQSLIMAKTQLEEQNQVVTQDLAGQAARTIEAKLKTVSIPIELVKGFRVEVVERVSFRDKSKYYSLQLSSQGKDGNKYFSTEKQVKALGVSDAGVLKYAETVESLNRSLRTIQKYLKNETK